jgi:hypothetical protein
VDQNNVGGYATCFTVNGTSASTGVTDLDTTYFAPLATPLSAGCSQITGYAAVGSAPGPFSDSGLVVWYHTAPTSLNGGGSYGNYRICDFNPGGAGGAQGVGTCSGSVAVSLNPGDEIVVCLASEYATPAHTNFAWALQCTAP